MLDKITDRALEKLQVQKVTEIKDKGTGSSRIMYCRARPTGKKQWHVRYYSPVKQNSDGSKIQQRQVLGEFPAIKRDEARRLAFDIEIALSKGKDPAIVKAEKESSKTVEAIFRKYDSKHLKSLSERRRREVSRMFVGHGINRPRYGEGGTLKWKRDELQKIVFA